MLQFFMTGGRNAHCAFHGCIHRIAVRHGTGKTARITGGAHRDARTNRASNSNALRLSGTQQLNTGFRQGALHDVVAHQTRETARIQTSRHDVRVGTFHRALLRDGAHHNARETAGVVFICKTDRLVQAEIPYRTIRNFRVHIVDGSKLTRLDDVAIEQQRNSIAKADTGNDIQQPREQLDQAIKQSGNRPVQGFTLNISCETAHIPMRAFHRDIGNLAARHVDRAHDAARKRPRRQRRRVCSAYFKKIRNKARQVRNAQQRQQRT